MSELPEPHPELPPDSARLVFRVLHRILRMAACAIALMMVVVILEGVVRVVRTVQLNLAQPRYFIIPDIVQSFAAFLAVLIAYQIFSNITQCIRADVFPVKLVLATALMAIARKIVVIDLDKLSALVGIDAAVLALAISYWLISRADFGRLCVQSPAAKRKDRSSD